MGALDKNLLTNSLAEGNLNFSFAKDGIEVQRIANLLKLDSKQKNKIKKYWRFRNLDNDYWSLLQYIKQKYQPMYSKLPTLEFITFYKE